MEKSKDETQRIPGHLRSTDRASYRMLTSGGDPHFALHTMTHSMREVVKKKRVSGGWAKPDDPIHKQGWTIRPVKSGRRQKR